MFCPSALILSTVSQNGKMLFYIVEGGTEKAKTFYELFSTENGKFCLYVPCTINILRLLMMPLELSVSNANIWSITLELSITILEVSFTLIYDVYSTGITYDDCQLTIMICL
jgi:hypothetical protein